MNGIEQAKSHYPTRRIIMSNSLTFKHVKHILIMLCPYFLAIHAFAQDTQLVTCWQIGKLDNSASELALAPDDYKQFVPEGFGGAHRYYVVGESTPADDFPFLIPGPKDAFAGYGRWAAGATLNTLPVYFNISNLPEKGTCRLTIDILAVNADEAPLFRCTINGTNFDQLLTAGTSPAPDEMRPNPQTVSFTLPVHQLKKGINEIIFQNMTGQWFAFDAIRFYAPPDLRIVSPGNTLIRSVAFSDFELRGEPVNSLPLLVDCRHKGKPVKIKAVVDSQERILTMEEGHSVLEFAFPAISQEITSRVDIYVDDNLVFSDKRTRNPRPLITPSDYVNQFMGTSASRWMIAPGPWMPMAMVKIAPDNENSRWKAGYEFQVENIMGFSHVHEWTMAGLLMMPANGPLKIQPGPEENPDLGYRSRMNKQTEVAEIGRYKTHLLDYDITAELTATTRAAMQRYTLPADRQNRVLIDLHFPAEYYWELRDAEIIRTSDTELVGRAQSHCSTTGYHGEQDYTLYFVVQFDKPMASMGGWIRDRIVETTDKIDRVLYEPFWNHRINNFNIMDAGAFIHFDKGITGLKVRTGISLVGIEQARLNLTEEIIKPFGWDFEAVVQNQKDTWNRVLGRVEIETPDRLQKVKFYSNFYRAVCPRNTWSDVNGKWVDMDEIVRQTAPNRPIYGSDGYWGWHWNLVQFYNLIMPEFSSNWIHTYLSMYEHGGWLPRGNPGIEYFAVMPGEPEIPLMVAAYQHGIRDYDVDKMFEALIHQQTALPEAYPGGGQVGNESYPVYLERGYVPLKSGYQGYVSNTLEYAYQDWCVGQLAKALREDSVHQVFMQRSEKWRNVFDPETGFVRPRNPDGSWYDDFSPYNAPGFCESNSWQYSWYVPQNLPGLIELLGKGRFIRRLNSAMEASEKVYFNALADNFMKYPINHGNESNMQSSYLFNYAGAPWLTQKWTRAIQEKYYGMGPRDAYPGDEDQGQMSAWYVMSSIGLFQMDGGASVNPHYELGSPRFEKVTIHLSDTYYEGNTFVIEARNASRENKYIHGATLDGKALQSWRFPQKQLIKGGKLILEMKAHPLQP